MTLQQSLADIEPQLYDEDSYKYAAIIADQSPYLVVLYVVCFNYEGTPMSIPVNLTGPITINELLGCLLNTPWVELHILQQSADVTTNSNNWFTATTEELVGIINKLFEKETI